MLRDWTASWIGPAYDPKQDLGLFWFQSSLDLEVIPDSLVVRISADQRYILRVNGQLAHRGPQRGDARHWFFDVVDIAAFLVQGANDIRAEVWNFGWMAPMAQHTVRTGFLLEADSPYGSLSTPGDWKVAFCDWFDFRMMSDGIGDFYIDVGPGEIVDATARSRFESAIPWRSPNVISRAESRGQPGGGTQWSLIERSLPLFRDEAAIAPVRVLRGDSVSELVPWTGKPLVLEPGQPVIVDFGELVVGYPAFHVSASAESEVSFTYAESPVDSKGDKGHRCELAGKRIKGYRDVLRLSNGEAATFQPQWMRTFRYIEISADQPCVIESCSSAPWTYPHQVESSFATDEPSIQPIWDASVRTLKLCAGESYFDCPYYEQLQYVGDSRIQALCGYYLSRDRSLQRNAIDQIGRSLMENGLTQSRYPSRQTQVIPPFSLWWVMMLFDACRYDSPKVAAPWLGMAQGVVDAYRRIIEDGAEPFWCFGDWVPGWKWGIPPDGPAAEMHVLTLNLAEAAIGAMHSPDLRFDWPKVRPFRPDQPVSEHAEALWRYGQRLSGQTPDEFPDLEVASRCTYYFQYYALTASMPEDYVSRLDPWREMLNRGLTTFAENPEPTRSDCHAWSAHPVVGLLREVAGIDSAGPGWSAVSIAPRPGSLPKFNASVAHPKGNVNVRFVDARLRIEAPVPIHLKWKGTEAMLKPGEHFFE